MYGYLRQALSFAVWIGGCAFFLQELALAADKPNVVLILADDAAYSDFGFSAALNDWPTFNETPNLDALAQQSVIATQAYAAHTLCSPSRAGLLTGQYQQRFGYEYNIVESLSSNQGLFPEQLTIAQRLKPLGYTTGAIGKWHLGAMDDLNRPLDKGFDEFYGLLGGSRNYFYDTNDHHAIFKGNQYYEQQYRQEGDPSKYDPTKGRYVTDAFGEEAVSFIDRHADDEDPFFLYLSYTAPHTPHASKKADYDRFSNVSEEKRRIIAGEVYAMDRSIGEVLDAISANNLDENTIVIFASDQGATYDLLNYPYRGFKGTSWEGGIRVPFLIRGPGLTPGHYDTPITFYDIMPTLVTAAGGDVSEFEHDGEDILPFLKGEAVDDPNEPLFWRHMTSYAVRKGDWKMSRPQVEYAGKPWLFNIKDNPQENVYLQAVHPEIVADLSRELTAWEATLAKPKWGIGVIPNLFDHFVFRNDVSTAANWNTAGNWRQGGTSNVATLEPTDAYANAIIEFGVRNDADYSSTNNMTRNTGFTFMLNQIRLSGDFTSAVSRNGTINGNALLFVDSLSGAAPQIRLDATSTGTAADFTFQVDNELQLFHDLEITGDGTQDFVIGGAIRDYYEPQQPTVTTPHSVRKSGTSSVTLKGTNTFAGTLTVEQGQVTLDGPSAAINGAAGIDVGPDGTFRLQSGNVAVQWIDNNNGGTFQFVGGTLKVKQVLGNLTNSGGVFSPGASPAVSVISGNFQQHSGSTVIEIGGTAVGTQYDSLVIGGSALVVGTLDVDLLNGYVPGVGDAFQVLTAMGGVNGVFTETLLPALPAGRFWNVLQGANSVILAVAPTAELAFIPGDFNLDGTVDAADYTVWRDHLGTSFAAADANFDGQVTTADYSLWKSHFGFSLAGSGFASQAMQSVVPEPTAIMLLMMGFIGVAFSRRRS
jgi:autotransporter-associated beta strand protein